MKDDYKPILCVDFDGVLHSYDSGWQGVAIVRDGPVPGAMAWLIDAAKVFRVAIYSSRSKEHAGVQAMSEALFDWLQRDTSMTAVEAHGFVMNELTFPMQKPSAFLTIDDRAICFDGTFPTMEAMLDFKPWNKKAPTKSEADRAFDQPHHGHKEDETA